ncbi:hypothetical protein AN476_00480 [Phaeobacter sp. 11ANDIMAR09]|nr:hypothetical protein AN476_00480 [Phaeobacter sp. 11ANDIMAR09]
MRRLFLLSLSQWRLLQLREILSGQSRSQQQSFIAAAPRKLLPHIQRFTRWGDRLLKVTLTGIKVVESAGGHNRLGCLLLILRPAALDFPISGLVSFVCRNGFSFQVKAAVFW